MINKGLVIKTSLLDVKTQIPIRTLCQIVDTRARLCHRADTKEAPSLQRDFLMSPPDTTLAEELALLQRQTADIRRLCRKQRQELADQFNRLQAIRRAIKYVETSLETSRNELWESRLMLDLHSADRLYQTRSGRVG